MVRSIARSALFASFLLSSLYADVTLRYETTVTMSPIMPPEALDQVKQTGAGPITMLVKGSRGYTLAASLASVTDLQKQTSTVMDTSKKTYASVAINDYQQAVSELVPKSSPDVQRVLSNMEMSLESKNTGRTETIHGILAQERQIVMTTSMKAATDQEKPGVMSRMVVEIWTAAPGEAARVPALGEIDRFNALSKTAMDPTTMIQQMLGSYTGVTKGYDALAKELLDRPSLVLRTRVRVYMPAMAQAATALAGAGRKVPEFDPNGPLTEIKQELVEISTAPVNDAAFEVPVGYQQSTMLEILRTRFPQFTK
jgi:hypothetical protein